MPLLDFINSSPDQGSNPLTQWRVLLSEAKEALWNQNIEKASLLFSKVSKEAESSKPKSLDDPVFSIRTEAKLGLWALVYLRNPDCRAGFRELLEGQDRQTRFWLFVAKVFGLKRDTNPEAIFVYTTFLEQKPTEAHARTVVGLLGTAGFSEEALNLLKATADLLPEDLEVSAWCCRWTIKANHPEEAARRARRILSIQHDHIEANRCLGYLAEIRGDWKEAARHYTFSNDRLRQAVCLNHIKDYEQALSCLQKIDPSERKNFSFLYHAGWASYQAGNPAVGAGYWKELKRLYWNKGKGIDEQLSFFKKRAYYHVFENFDLAHLGEIPEQLPEDYKNELLMRTSAAQLMLMRNPQSAQEKFHKLAVQSPKSLLPSTYLLAAVASQKTDLSIDKTYVEQLQKFYGNASLYLFFRGLWLAHLKPETARMYIDKAVQLNVSQYLPCEAVAGVRWLLNQRCGNGENLEQLTTDLVPTNPKPEAIVFLQAIAASILLHQIKLHTCETPAWINSLSQSKLSSPTDLDRIQMIYHASCGQWSETFKHSQQVNDHKLEQELITFGLNAALQKKNFVQAAEIASHSVKRYPENSRYREIAGKLEGAVLTTAWQNKDYRRLIQQMEVRLSSLPGDTQIHHTLALLYTRWVMQDENNSSSNNTGLNVDLWKHVIGHWAVALSDKRYWSQWKKQRNQSGEEGLEELSIDDLINERIPEVLKSYFNEQENQAKAAEADRFHSYSILLEQELDVVAAMRRLIAKSVKTGENLPEIIQLWLSPILIKQHDGENEAKKLVSHLTKYELSRMDQRLIRLAFSPLGEIVHIAASGKYTQALSKLENLEKNRTDNKAHQRETEEEHIFILESYIQELIKAQRWLYAKNRAHEGMKLCHGNKTFEKLYINASLGLANAYLADEGQNLEVIISDLREVKKNIQQPELEPELDALLAEVLVKFGFEALVAEHIARAEKRFEEALALSPSNLRAREGKAWVYLDKAAKASDKDDHRLAYECAKTMYEFSQIPTMVNNYALAVAKYAISLRELGRYQTAIDILFSMQDIPYDPDKTDLEGILASILVDHGANLLNTGQRSAGIKATRMALQLEPDNQVARNNLRIATGARY